ncbi:hypothetical protein C5167_025871 [Papaver somniferum]|uniref:Uncharacterized protein n=1 Tax=Papaver somniferum TaxID=3469 RepID=A0A4Y7JU79_PAPSO|nr:hypothetical protein C5167_025871 [Papaver somniferum]
MTLLHLAAKGGHLKVMDELLKNGVNIDARTKGACGYKSIGCSIHHLDGDIGRYKFITSVAALDATDSSPTIPSRTAEVVGLWLSTI